jgi:hypothetical protein
MIFPVIVEFKKEEKLKQILSLGLSSPRPGATGVGDSPALTGKGWEWVGWAGEGTGGPFLLRIAYPPTSPPRKRLGGRVGGLARQDRPVPLKSFKWGKA